MAYRSVNVKGVQQTVYQPHLVASQQQLETVRRKAHEDMIKQAKKKKQEKTQTPSGRLSPVEHIVHQHKRHAQPDKKTSSNVREYERGDRRPETHVLSGYQGKSTTVQLKNFSVGFRYADDDTASANVESKNYISALEQGIGFAQKQIKSISLTIGGI